MKQSRRQWTEAEKSRIMAEVAKGKSVPDVAERHGANESLVYYWLRKAKDKQASHPTAEPIKAKAQEPTHEETKRADDILPDAAPEHADGSPTLIADGDTLRIAPAPAPARFLLMNGTMDAVPVRYETQGEALAAYIGAAAQGKKVHLFRYVEVDASVHAKLKD